MIARFAVLFLLASSLAYAGGSRDYFNNGNQAFRDGDYRTAIRLYERAEVKNADLYYNLALAYRADGKPGRAILYLNRAKMLSPRDEQISGALATLRKEVAKGQTTEGPPGPPPLVNLFSLNELGIASAFFFTMSAVCVALPRIKRSLPQKPFRIVSSVMGLLFCLSVFGASLRYHADHLATTVVVTTAGMVARTASTPTAEPAFDMPEGTEAEVLENENRFIKVKLPSGLTGWVPENGVEILNPN